MPINAFLSYTLKGNDLTCSTLERIREQFNKINNYVVYIDRLDNKIPIYSKDIKFKENVNSKYQKKVIHALFQSDLLCLLESDEISKSEWVEYEIKLTREKNIGILRIKKEDWMNFLVLETVPELLNSNFIKMMKALTI